MVKFFYRRKNKRGERVIKLQRMLQPKPPKDTDKKHYIKQQISLSKIEKLIFENNFLIEEYKKCGNRTWIYKNLDNNLYYIDDVEGFPHEVPLFYFTYRGE